MQSAQQLNIKPTNLITRVQNKGTQNHSTHHNRHISTLKAEASRWTI